MTIKFSPYLLFAVFALATGLCAFMLLGEPTVSTVQALTPTVTPTSTPTVPAGYRDITLTNTSGQSVDTAEFRSAEYMGIDVIQQPPGCMGWSMDSQGLGFESVTGLHPTEPINVPVVLMTIHFGFVANCFDNGETLKLRLRVGDDNDLLMFDSIPITSTFFRSSLATPTATPSVTPPTPFHNVSLQIDCNIAAAGIQTACDVPIDGGSVAVDVYAVSHLPLPMEVLSFGFRVVNPDRSRLDAVAPPCASPGSDCNPDFLEASVSGPILCAPPLPDEDRFPAQPLQQSEIGCFSGSTGAPFAIGTPMALARVTYDIAGGAALGTVPLTIAEGSLYIFGYAERMSCNAVISRSGPCIGAELTLVESSGEPTATATPTPVISSPTTTPTSAGFGSTPTSTPTDPFFIAIDCDSASPGWQSSCEYPVGTDRIIANVILVNNGSFTRMDAFGFGVRIPSTDTLVPLSGPPTLDGNPDFPEASFGSGYVCTSPLPRTRNVGAAAITEIGCNTLTPAPVHAGITVLGAVTYAVDNDLAPGSMTLTLVDGSVTDFGSQKNANCNPGPEFMPCLSATISFAGPLIEKVPDGNEHNADLSIPAANLWICETGPCSGPGEGSLRVVESAVGVTDGLGAYEFSVEYDNFVIQSINPCDLAFGPGGAGAARGPVDELDSASMNPDCAPDPGTGGSNGSCAMSLVLENVVHFGCATNGQLPGPTGLFNLASLLLIPHPDLNNDLFPGNNNGVLTVLKDNGCELVDTLGHPVAGSINGGLTPFCRDLAITVRILEGDVDLDCDVDLTDAQTLASRYGAFFGGLLYAKWYDLEPQFHDLDIDIKDVQKVFGRQGSTCQVPIPAQLPQGPPAPFED